MNQLIYYAEPFVCLFLIKKYAQQLLISDNVAENKFVMHIKIREYVKNRKNVQITVYSFTV